MCKLYKDQFISNTHLFLILFKLIVAKDESELGRLDILHEKGIQNKVPDLRMVDADEIKDIEPNCVVSV